VGSFVAGLFLDVGLRLCVAAATRVLLIFVSSSGAASPMTLIVGCENASAPYASDGAIVTL
jgi:hypothetical protein